MQSKKVKTTQADIEYRQRLSPWRLFLFICMCVGVIFATLFFFRQWKEDKKIAAIKPWFAAYVDVTSTPLYAFEQLGSTSTSSVVLAFIVSAASDDSDQMKACTPSWGTYYTLDEASVALDLDRRIARLQQQDGRVAISFGGALNNELALVCNDLDDLVAAYKAVVDRYNIDTIDLDLENSSLSNKQAAERRAQAIAQLQTLRRAEGKSLAVWLTLPVAPQGLTQDGTDAVASMLKAGVDIAGVNVMTMDYGASKEEDDTMLMASQKALIETQRQLSVLYKQANISLSSATLWRKIGATPMIGQNDVVNEVFSLEDAKGLSLFARERGIGRMSMWSANRDLPCGGNYVDTQIVSDSCSGVDAEEFAFAQALSEGFSGDLTQNATIVTIDEPEATEQIVDDPTTSPYQIWHEKGAYLKGTKVVWHGHVYESKWWTKGDMPDNPVLQTWETPWQLVGPVLPGEKPVEQPTLPVGTYPAWLGTEEYGAGQRVLFEGIPYQAKWWNKGESPAAAEANADSSPWVPLTQQEVKEILENKQ